MSPPKFDVVLPYQFYNLIYSVITILCLLWGMVAMKRIYRMLQIRTAALTDRIIHIRGLGSYLTYFDGATRSHMDAVVHTRQSMPPVVMKQLSIPALPHTISLMNDLQHAELHLQTACPAKVVVVFEFNSANFQRLMVQVKNELAGTTNYSDSRIFNAITGAKESSLIASKSLVFPRFQRNECCSFECLCEEVQEGSHKLVFPMLATMTSCIQDKIAAARANGGECKLSFAVIVLPSVPQRGASAGSTGKQQQQQRYSRNQLAGGKVSNYDDEVDAERGELGEAADDASTDDQDADADSFTGVMPSEQTALRASGGSSSTLSSSPSGATQVYKTGRNPLTNSRAGKKGYVNASSSEGPAEISTSNSNSSTHSQSRSQADSKAPTVFGAVFVYSMNLQGLVQEGQAQRAPGAAMASASPADLLVLDRAAAVYQAQEIFGLAVPPLPSTPTSTSPPTPTESSESGGAGAAVDNVPTSTNGNSSTAGTAAGDGNVVGAAGCFGGLFHEEDCVVCLTLPKEVLLLPCRHLCVCEACLVFIDKCPVCRAAFEEYVTIKPPGTAATPLPAPGAALAGANGGAAVNGGGGINLADGATTTSHGVVLSI